MITHRIIQNISLTFSLKCYLYANLAQNTIRISSVPETTRYKPYLWMWGWNDPHLLTLYVVRWVGLALTFLKRYDQGVVKGAILCFRNPYFYFWHGESTSTASQLTSPASQKSKDLNKVSLLLQDLGLTWCWGEQGYWIT